MVLLVKAGLHRFAIWTTKLPHIDPKLVQTFLETYNSLEWRTKILKLAPILSYVNHVKAEFLLSTKGPSVTNLGNIEYNVA